jgi:N6-adenosine-specific RNA methylase IME4
MKYRTIVADPPWEIGDFPAWHREDRRSVRENTIGHNPTPYRTMTLDEIRALPVGNLADTTARVTHLYLWTCDQFLTDAIAIAGEWGFQKTATIVWCKLPMGGGLGGAWPNNVEFVLFCRRYWQPDNEEYQKLGAWLRQQRTAVGLTVTQLCAAIGAHGTINHGGSVANWETGLGSPTDEQWAKLKDALNLGAEMDDLVNALNRRKRIRTRESPLARTPGRWFNWSRGKHSEKPEAFLDLVEQVSPGPYVELFARRDRLGWDTWGDGSLQTAKLGPRLAFDEAEQ